MAIDLYVTSLLLCVSQATFLNFTEKTNTFGMVYICHHARYW